MANTASRFATAMMSAAALGVLAVVPGGIAIYMFAVMFEGHAASPTMPLLACLLGFVGAGLAVGCIYTVVWAFTKSGKEEKKEDDESWRDMPYPKG